ncbi:hypothetical protein EDC04DRAFT_2604914 [Pisolithus marmoratus]|nr:hypothetical protein EDC04DRAFT_2604914 [Pisolithus marmoratus]
MSKVQLWRSVAGGVVVFKRSLTYTPYVHVSDRAVYKVHSKSASLRYRSRGLADTTADSDMGKQCATVGAGDSPEADIDILIEGSEILRMAVCCRRSGVRTTSSATGKYTVFNHGHAQAPTTDTPTSAFPSITLYVYYAGTSQLLSVYAGRSRFVKSDFSELALPICGRSIGCRLAAPDFTLGIWDDTDLGGCKVKHTRN